jgi:hypothetical protein
VIISPEQAVRKILGSGNHELFESFPDLAELRKTVIKQERKPSPDGGD